MNEMVKRTWTGLSGQLVFEFTINRGSSDGVPSRARIFCRQDSRDEEIVSVHDTRPTPLDIEFGSGCRVRGYLEQRAHVHIDGVDNTGIFADIHFGPNEESHFEGLMVACSSRSGPTPCPPDPPHPPWFPERDDSGSPLPIIRAEPDALFNYMYVRRWPRVTDEDLRYGFIQYSPSSPPASSFYEDLVAARQKGYAATQDLAVRFIDGDPPYQGVFVSSLGCLSGPVRDFAVLADQIQRRSEDCPRALVAEIEPLLQRFGEPWSYFTSTEFRTDLDRIWQSYFALIVMLGYDWALLEQLAQALWLAHSIELVFHPNDPGQPPPPELSPEQVAEIVDAKVLLPTAVFPLPAADQSSTPPPTADGWIAPYAIGELQMVRQRLIRYAPGEIARIENVMRGERREVSRRNIQRRVEVTEQRGSEEQLLQNDDADERSSLLEETHRMVAEKSVTNNYSNFKTNYGPPTLATLDGSWTRATTQGAKPGVDDVTRFARELLNKTVSRIRRKVGTVRTTTTMNQVEDVITSVIDNTSGRASMRAVFRWLNKVYEASVVNYGSRLMMEFLVHRPAARYVALEAASTGERLVRPIPPAQLGIRSFNDIHPDNYAQLGARYGVTEIVPPPLAQKYVTATLRGGEEQQIMVPSGYCAVTAFVGCVSTPAGSPDPVVLVGRQTFKSGSASGPLPPYGEDSTIPISVMGTEISSSSALVAQVLVNVEIECAPTDRTKDEWRIAIYRSVMTSYQQQENHYYGEYGPRGGARSPTRSPMANRQIEQGQLQQACIRLLLDHMARLTGTQNADASPPPPSPSPALVNEPRYIQFLDGALEWTEMGYSFHVKPHAGTAVGSSLPALVEPDEDPLFTSFLQADQARVLLPVQPSRVLAFLYAFSSGTLWEGADRWVPVLADDLTLVNDLEHATRGQQPVREVGPCWELVVPTSMQILDESIATGTDALGGL